MSGKRFLDHDEFTGISRWFHWDDIAQTTSIESVADTSNTLEQNRILFNEDEYKKSGYKNEMVHVARVDPIVIEQWLKEGINFYDPDHWPKVKQKLNSPDFRYLRTSSGRI